MTTRTARESEIATLETPLRARRDLRSLATHQVFGPLLALVVAVIVFSLTTTTFFNSGNLALIAQQSVVVGTLALGQTLIILTSGIDLANGAIMVLGSVVIGKMAVSNDPVLAAVVGLLVCVALGAVNGALVSWLKLPPFIVTLGVMSVVMAAARLFTDSQSYPITSDFLTVLNEGPTIGGVTVTYGVMLWIGLTAVLGFALTQTSWGVRVYAIGDNARAAELAGIKVRRVLLSVYVVAGLVYALAAWQALGRTPTADPSGYMNGNLDSITAVVIGGTSLLGGRGGVVGTLIGALIVTVLQNGLTQAGIDSLYQQVATGVLVIVAVGVDHLARRRQAR
ncbi:ABC transporter permease [Streptomyces sp. NBC_01754]|uniref:ABC transporter permease n=1 Tax=Streptomyces sp. NBC_01754 TaxID=2975930 RepID=UPI002DD81500|nr:ABC transporter permease [Streptomyces sp. NBC_01754]WSC94032.1 ABC transporter permease [Streptomyces sp. NBC_01754]